MSILQRAESCISADENVSELFGAWYVLVIPTFQIRSYNDVMYIFNMSLLEERWQFWDKSWLSELPDGISLDLLPVFCQFHDGGRSGGERYEGHS